MAERELAVPREAAGERLDRFLAGLPEITSRAEAERLVAGGLVLVDGRREPKSHRLSGGESLTVSVEERAVGELVELTGQSQPKVSNHLACLRWCGFVVARREHPRVQYSIADPRVIEVIAMARALLERNADHVACCRVLESEKGSGRGRS